MAHQTPSPWGMLGGVDLYAATIHELQRSMDRGELTSGQLVAWHLSRIAEVDPRLRSVIAVNPYALREAERSDERRRRYGPRGKLEGIPVLVKGTIDVQGLPTTAGSSALRDCRLAGDAHIVALLRTAGAIVLGHANLSEFNNFRSPNGVNGWSAVRGQTRNPHVLDRDPSGSSSGSAAAVAAGLATVAIGVETNGSIVAPCAACGVVGLKPSVGLVSRHGVVPVSDWQDTAGPVARTVTDAAIVLSAIQGVDIRDAVTREAPSHTVAGARSALRADALTGKRVGVCLCGDEADVTRVVEDAVAALRERGATVVHVPAIDIANAERHAWAAKFVEFKHGINAYLAGRRGDHPRDLAALIAFNREHADAELAAFGQEWFEQAEATSGDVAEPAYCRNRTNATTTARQAIDDVLGRYELDAIMAPTASPARPTYGTGGVRSASPAAIAGYPNITVPAGTAFGVLPVGVSFFGGRWSDYTLIEVAYAFEQATQARIVPRLLTTLPE